MHQLRLLSDRTKGYLFAIIATISFSNVYIFSKAALNEVSLSQFGLYWFAIGAFFNFIFSLRNGSFRVLKGVKIKAYRIFLFLAVLEIATTATFFISINTITDPAVTSFIGNMYVVFLVIMGVIMLKERFTFIESIGILITITGAFAVGYKGGNSIDDFFVKGTGIVLLNTFLAAFTSIFAKKAIRRFNPSLVNLNRTLFLLLFAVGFFFISGDSFIIPKSALINIFIGAILGPVTGILTVYYSFKYIEASRSSVIQGLKGVFVLIGSYLYIGMFPQTIQFIGSLVSVLGVLIMTISKAKILNWRIFKSK
jgi:drug/metabolite transporter (DMT)-like permease